MKRQPPRLTSVSAADVQRRREAYLKKFKDPRWQKMRLDVMNRDEFACQLCFDSKSTLNVHHRYYDFGKDPWEYPLEALVTLCESCHESETESRPEEERLLLRSLRYHFFSAELSCLSVAFAEMTLTHIPEVVADALAWAVRTPELQRELVDRHLADVSARQRERERTKDR